MHFMDGVCAMNHDSYLAKNIQFEIHANLRYLFHQEIPASKIFQGVILPLGLEPGNGSIPAKGISDDFNGTKSPPLQCFSGKLKVIWPPRAGPGNKSEKNSDKGLEDEGQ